MVPASIRNSAEVCILDFLGVFVQFQDILNLGNDWFGDYTSENLGWNDDLQQFKYIKLAIVDICRICFYSGYMVESPMQYNHTMNSRYTMVSHSACM
jgi:hypothetical protein